MDFGIKGKVALVTGGSRGLGKHAALSLAGEGVNVAISGRTQETLDKTVGELKDLGVSSVGVVADVSDLSTAESAHKQVVDSLGPVDILVNNAGGGRPSSTVADTSFENYLGTFNLNLFGAFQLMQLVIPNMQAQHWGRIISITSIYGREYGGNVSYMSAKAALIATTKHAGVTLAKDGVLFNTIAPGSISHEQGGWERFQSDNPPDVVEDFIKNNLPMGKFGWPEPVGDLVAFLASERANLITGACIVVDGGQSYSLI